MTSLHNGSLSISIALTLVACTGSATTDAGNDARADAASEVSGHDSAADSTSDVAADATTDATTDSSPDVAPVDPCANRLLCDNFEADSSGAAPAGPWQTYTSHGNVVVDGMHSFSGTHAVHVSTESGTYKSAMFYTDGAPVFPIASGVVYGRMMFYTDHAANDGVHWTMIDGSGPVPGHAGVTANYRYGGMWMGQLMANYDTSGASSDCWDNVMTALPTGRWTCMEWRFDTAANDMRFWLDGTEIPALHVAGMGQGCIAHDLSDQWLAPTFQRMSLGWESYQTDDARDAWIDDVIIDDAPIGCPTAR